MPSSSTQHKRKQHSDYELGMIAGILKSGITRPSTISEILGILVSTIRDAITRYNNNGTTLYENKRTGRPPAMSEREIRYLKRSMKSQPFQPLTSHLANLHSAGIDVSRATMMKNLDVLGYHSRVPACRPSVSSSNVEDRLA
ncbi:hypothetical protein PS15p_212265 [Mucor circinelloides]